MSDTRCICTMSQSLTGDGCRWCQPQEHIDRLGQWLDEERQDNERLSDLARFLLDRLSDFEPDNITEESARDWHGHVAPAMARLEQVFEGES